MTSWRLAQTSRKTPSGLETWAGAIWRYLSSSFSASGPGAGPDGKREAGDILNTVSNQVYSGKTGIRVIPSAYQRRFIEWASGHWWCSCKHLYARRPAGGTRSRGQQRLCRGWQRRIWEKHQLRGDSGEGQPTTALIPMKSTQLKKNRRWNSTVAAQHHGQNGPSTPADHLCAEDRLRGEQ